MSSSIREEVLRHLQTTALLQPALHKQTHAPSPTEIDHTLYRAYTRTPHDVGGEPDVPIEYQEKERGSLGAEHLCHMRVPRLARCLDC